MFLVIVNFVGLGFGPSKIIMTYTYAKFKKILKKVAKIMFVDIMFLVEHDKVLCIF